MFISVIIPVHNGGETFRQCLAALNQTLYDQWECLVVDDNSTDGSAVVAQQYGARVIGGWQKRLGPAQARNVGAQMARGDVLFFLDADVMVQPGTVGHVAATMQAESQIAACYGSYDDEPAATNFLSRYRTMQHFYFHQHSNVEAATFRSSVGAIRRDIFLALGGFNAPAFPRPGIEDIELGYRLHAAGYEIRLEKLLLVKHLKRWSWRDMVVTDIRDRAIPWTQLILQDKFVPNDLNLQRSQRLSTAVAILGLLALLLVLFSGWGWLLVAASVITLLWLNHGFYSYVGRKRGVLFSFGAMLTHWFYLAYTGFAFLVGAGLYVMGRMTDFQGDRLRPLPSTSYPLPRSSSKR